MMLGKMRAEKPDTYMPPPKRHTLRRLVGLTLAGSVSFGGIATYQNRENLHIVVGLFNNDGEIAIPEVAGCEDISVDITLATAPPETTDAKKRSTATTIVLPSDTLSPPTSTAAPNTIEIPETTVTISAYERELLGHNSAVHKFDPSDPQAYLDLMKVPFQYKRYFENRYMTHVSARSGTEYPIYLFGNTVAPPQINTDSIDQLEYAPFDEKIRYFEPNGMQEAVDCMRRDIFEEKKFAGRSIPLIIPTVPATIENGLIKFYGQTGSSGYTMPYAEFSLLFFELNPKYKEFIILTTGPIYDPNNPYVEPWLMSHEFGHKWAEIVQKNYRLHVGPEERTAHELHRKAKQLEDFACILPPVVYGDPEVIRQRIASLPQCE